MTWESLSPHGAAVEKRVVGVLEGMKGREVDELRKGAGCGGKTR